MKPDELTVGEFYALGAGTSAKRAKYIGPDPESEALRHLFELDDGEVRGAAETNLSTLYRRTWTEYEIEVEQRKALEARRVEREELRAALASGGTTLAAGNGRATRRSDT